MTQADAISKAKEFVLRHVGIEADPASVRLMERRGGARYWSIVYMPEAFFPQEAAIGARIDGPYVLQIDDSSGEVCVLG